MGNYKDTRKFSMIFLTNQSNIKIVFRVKKNKCCDLTPQMKYFGQIHYLCAQFVPVAITRHLI